MPINLRCPKCAATATVDESLSGKKVRCRSCKEAFTATAVVDTLPAPSGRTTLKPEGKPTPPPAPAPVVGRFEIRKLLGKGAFGEVYHAVDTQLQREVALKVPRDGVLNSPKQIERFLREGKAAAGLNHPHIVPVYHAGQENGRYFLASAYIEGRTLAHVIDEKRPDFEEAARLVQSLAEALAYAHDLGIVHRDIKPANIMIDADGEPHVMDFGLAYRQEFAEKLTQEGAVMGTPAYMPPEQASGQQGEVKPTVDQYALGVVLYELLTGVLPFEGPVAVVLYNVVHVEPDAPRKRNPAVPADLETICLKAMAKDAAARYGDCQELADDLRRWLEGEPLHARRLSLTERLARFARRRPRELTLALVSFFILLGVSALVAGKVGDLRHAEAETADLALKARQREAETLARENEAQLQKVKTSVQLEESKTLETAAAEQLKRSRQAQEQLAKETAAIRDLRVSTTRENLKRLGVIGAGYLDLASLALNRNDLGTMRNWLMRARPASDQEDSRDERWFRLYDTHNRSTADRFSPRALGHTHRITSVAYSPEGSLQASASEDGTVKVWDSATGQLKRICQGHYDAVRAVVFLSDLQVASAGADWTVKVWDVVSGKELHTLKGHKGEVLGLAVSPNRRLLASAGADHLVKVWDLETASELLTFQGHTGAVNGVAFTTSGQQVVSGSADRTVRVWDIRKASELHTLTDHTGAVTCVASSLTGRYIATGGDDRTVKVWEPREWKCRASFDLSDRPLSLAFVGYQSQLFAGGADGKLRVWNVDQKALLIEHPLHAQGVTSLTFSPSSMHLLSGSQDRSVRQWGASLREATIPRDPKWSLRTCIAFGRAETSYVASGSQDGTVKVQQIDRGNAVVAAFPTHEDGVTALAWSPLEERLATASADWTVRQWQALTGTPLGLPLPHPGEVRCLTYTRDGKKLLTGCADGGVRVWDAVSGQLLYHLKGHGQAVRCLWCDRTGGKVVAGSADGVVLIWEPTTGKQQTLSGHRGAVLSVLVSFDGKTIASSGADRTVRLWDAVTGQVRFAPQRQAQEIVGLFAAPDVTSFYSTTREGVLSLTEWRTPRDQFIQVDRQHTRQGELTVSPSGNLLGWCPPDGEVRVVVLRAGPTGPGGENPFKDPFK